MKLNYFPESAYLELFDNIGTNQPNYSKKSNDWVSQIFGDRVYSKESRIDVSLPDLNHADGEFMNVVSFYNAMREKLTPKQASNPYLWSWLTHCHYWEYTHERWSKEEMSEDMIKQRFFCSFQTKNPEGNRVGFLRNSISRLWWFGYLTYQDDAKKPYELTELMLSNSDLCQSVMERNFSMNREVTIGILSAIKEINDDPNMRDVGAVSNGDHYEWRPLCKYINRYGGVVLLDTLDRNEIKKLAYDFLISYRNRNADYIERANTKPKEDKKVSKPIKDMSLKEFFEANGFKTKDSRPIGCLWVVGEKDALEPFVKEAENAFGVKGSYGVGRTIVNKNGWWTKEQK